MTVRSLIARRRARARAAQRTLGYLDGSSGRPAAYYDADYQRAWRAGRGDRPTTITFLADGRPVVRQVPESTRGDFAAEPQVDARNAAAGARR